MRVMINGIVYDASDQPIIAIFSDVDRKNIAEMPEGATVYGCFPGNFPFKQQAPLCREAKKHDYTKKPYKRNRP